MTRIELYKEEELIDSVMKKCDRFAVKLSPQSYLAKCLCLMVYSSKNVESDIEVNMIEVHCKPKTPLHFPYTRERTECKVGIQEI